MKKLNLPILLIISLLAVACRDKKDEPVIDNSTSTTEALPTADELTETTTLPVAIIGSGFSDVAQAFINRVQQPMSEIGSETKAILVRGVDLDTHLADEAVRNAIDNGAVLIIDQPTRHEMEVAIDSICTTEDLALSMDNEEHDYHICYDLAALDRNENIYTLNDIFDEDSDTITYAMTPYLNGLHADPLAAWLNEHYSANASAKSLLRAASSELSSVMNAQNITKTFTLEPGGNLSYKIKGRQCVFTVSTNIWAAYKFDEDADYYLIEQTIWGNNKNFWIGSWTNGNWSYQGFFLTCALVNNRLTHRYAGDGDFLKASDGAQLLNFSPTTTNGQSSTSVSVGWNLGGQVGLSTTGPSASVSGGISGSVSDTYTTQDMTITANCGSNDECNNNAEWQFDIKINNMGTTEWGYCKFNTPPALGTNAYKSTQCWLWKVENPKTYTNIKIDTELSFRHAYNSYRNYVFSYSAEIGQFFNNYREYITIRPPYRGEKK